MDTFLNEEHIEETVEAVMSEDETWLDLLFKDDQEEEDRQHDADILSEFGF